MTEYFTFWRNYKIWRACRWPL